MLVLAAGALGVALALRSPAVDPHEEVVDVSRRFALALAAYDYQDLDGAAAAVEALSTESFREEYREGVNTAEVQEALATSESVATATVELGPFVADLSDREARTFTVVEQVVRSKDSPSPTARRLRVELVLAETDDGWLVDDVVLT